MAQETYRITGDKCPGCAIPPRDRVYYPHACATLHVDADGSLFVQKDDALHTRVPVELVPYDPHASSQRRLPLDDGQPSEADRRP